MIPQAESAFTTIPSAATAPAGTSLIIHILICGSSRFGDYVRERGMTETVRDLVISDLASGEVDDCVSVLALDRHRGTVKDVSRAIALEVARQCDDAGYMCKDALSFCERHMSPAEIAQVWRRHGLLAA